MTVYDVAKAAGTSASTVSRVLNGSALIAPETRATVLDAADELGYRQRRVRRSASRSVLNVVVFLPRAAEAHAHLFYDAAALFAGIQKGLEPVRTHTIAALVGSTSPFEGKKLGDIDGCIFAFCDPPGKARRLLIERGIPAVVINRLDEQFACVVNDHEAGMAAIAALVAARRPQARPAWVTVATANPVAGYRRRALLGCEALRMADADCFEFGSIAQIGTESVASMLEAGYDTLICVNDLVAIAAYERLSLLGVRVPHGVGLTGYDAAPVRELLSQEIVTVDLAGEAMGRQAAEQLVEAILRRELPRGRTMVAGGLIAGSTL